MSVASAFVIRKPIIEDTEMIKENKNKTKIHKLILKDSEFLDIKPTPPLFKDKSTII
jgi:hypothetical protein